MFIIALGAAYLRGLSIECGCFTADLSPEKASEPEVICSSGSYRIGDYSHSQPTSLPMSQRNP